MYIFASIIFGRPRMHARVSPLQPRRGSITVTIIIILFIIYTIFLSSHIFTQRSPKGP